MNCYNFAEHNYSGSLVGPIIQWERTKFYFSCHQIARKHVSQQLNLVETYILIYIKSGEASAPVGSPVIFNIVESPFNCAVESISIQLLCWIKISIFNKK